MKKKKVVPKLRQEVKVKVDIITSDDIKIYYTGKFQDFTARYIIKKKGLLITVQWCRDRGEQYQSKHMMLTVHCILYPTK